MTTPRVYSDNKLASPRAAKLFLAREATAGVGVFPVAGDGLLVTEITVPEQPQDPIPDPQIRFTASRGAPAPGKVQVARLTGTAPIKITGTPGTLPEASDLFEGVGGIITTVPATSVSVTLADICTPLPTWSGWYGDELTASVIVGTVINRVRIVGDAVPNSENAILRAEFEALGLSVATMTEVDLNDEPDGIITTFNVGGFGQANWRNLQDAVGMYCQVSYFQDGSIDTNGGSGYLIQSVDPIAGTVTFSTPIATNPGADVAADGEIILQPFLPAVTEVGDLVHAGIGSATFGALDIDKSTFELTVDNQIVIPENIQTAADALEALYVKRTRLVEGQWSMYETPGNAFLDSYYKRTESGALHQQYNGRGAQAGEAFHIDLPKAYGGQVRKERTDQGLVRRFPFTGAYDAAFDDEVVLSWKAP